MGKNLLYTILVLTLISCGSGSENDNFRDFLTNYKLEILNLSSELFPYYGYLEFDDVLEIPEEEVFLNSLSICKEQLKAIQKINSNKLSTPFKYEYAKIQQFLQKTIYDLEVLKVHETDPTFYDLSAFFKYLLTRENNSLELKTDLLISNLSQLPDYYRNVKKNLKSSSSKNLKIALEQQKTMYYLLQKKVAPILQFKTNIFDHTVKDHVLSDAKIAVKDYTAYLNSLDFELKDQAGESLKEASWK